MSSVIEGEQIKQDLININKIYGLKDVLFSVFHSSKGPTTIKLGQEDELDAKVNKDLVNYMDSSSIENPFSIHEYENKCLASYLFETKSPYGRGGIDLVSVIVNTEEISTEQIKNKTFKELTNYVKEFIKNLSNEYKRIIEQPIYAKSIAENKSIANILLGN